jgi:hypothetical protein
MSKESKLTTLQRSALRAIHWRLYVRRLDGGEMNKSYGLSGREGWGG